MKKELTTGIYKSLARQISDIIYQTLFGKETYALLIQFTIPLASWGDEEDTLLRDHFGEMALEAVNTIEKRCFGHVRQFGKMNITYDTLLELVQHEAEKVAVFAKANAAGNGIDLLTGAVLSDN